MTIKYISPLIIEQIAERIRKDSLPTQALVDFSEVDIYLIAYKLGCKIELVDFDPPTVSAKVLRPESFDGYVIQISRQDTLKRQNFSIAHEIAHIILHDEDKNSGFIEARQSLVDYKPDELYKEIQANMLAAALLLPEEQVRLAWGSSKSVDDIAEIFNVSKEAACNRLLNLGLLRNE
jgi:Zn-dependent peptidase ImmA (M78 family)